MKSFDSNKTGPVAPAANRMRVKPALKILLSFVSGLFVLIAVTAQAAAPKPLSADFFERLGVSRTASKEEIKAAFRTASKLYHPDLHPGIDPRFFQNINDAYASLQANPGQSFTGTANPREAYRSQSTDEWRAERDQLLGRLVARLNVLYGPSGSALGETTEEELKILKLTFVDMAEDKYYFEDLLKIKGMTQIFERAFQRPAWSDVTNGLFRGFIESFAFYSLRYQPELLATLFSGVPFDDPYLQRVLLRAEFSSPGSDFQRASRRNGIVVEIAARMLHDQRFRGTPQGKVLLEHVLRSWKSIRVGAVQSESIRATLRILELLDVPEFYENKSVRQMMFEIWQWRESFGRFFYGEFEIYLKKYPDAFAPPAAVVRPANDFNPWSHWANSCASILGSR